MNLPAHHADIPRKSAAVRPPQSGARTAPRELGRGRSGVVYLSHDEHGRPLARKVFGAHGLTALVQWLFIGAPNPYQWNRHAARCTVLRRSILGVLVRHWFGKRLRVAEARGCRWCAQERAFELVTEFCGGRPPALSHPLRAGDDEAAELGGAIMPELQEHLRRAGFDGLLWQAGLGNPVALNNFLLETHQGQRRWCWIDLESGVPALFPLDPRALFGFYLPRSIRFGRPLFDDVDIERLRAYLGDDALLVAALGDRAHTDLLARVDELEAEQRAWKSQRRLHRAVDHAVSRGRLGADEAIFYRSHAVRWYLHEVAHLARRAPGWLGAVAVRLARCVAALQLGRRAGALWRFVVSSRYRAVVARRFVAGRIEAWSSRGQLDPAAAESLRRELEGAGTSGHLVDFGVHLGIKPFVNAAEWWLCPALFAAGVIDGLTLAFAMAASGILVRTLYTLARIVDATLSGRERPWVALAAGLLPVVGNLAFPFQIVFSCRARDDRVARFIVYDAFSRAGELLPIWGGRDTWTEHALNRLAARIVEHPPARLQRRRSSRKVALRATATIEIGPS